MNIHQVYINHYTVPQHLPLYITLRHTFRSRQSLIHPLYYKKTSSHVFSQKYIPKVLAPNANHKTPSPKPQTLNPKCQTVRLAHACASAEAKAALQAVAQRSRALSLWVLRSEKIFKLWFL